MDNIVSLRVGHYNKYVNFSVSDVFLIYIVGTP
jgi:hypothetical protein